MSSGFFSERLAEIRKDFEQRRREVEWKAKRLEIAARLMAGSIDMGSSRFMCEEDCIANAESLMRKNVEIPANMGEDKEGEE